MFRYNNASPRAQPFANKRINGAVGVHFLIKRYTGDLTNFFIGEYTEDPIRQELGARRGLFFDFIISTPGSVDRDNARRVGYV